LARRSRALAALALAWLALAADVLYGGPVSALDVWLADRVQAVRGSELAQAMLFWSNLHSHLALLVYAALLVPGAMLLNYGLKLAVQRTRPVLENPILALNTYSFPSGHTAATTAFYGMLAAYLAFRYPRHRRLWSAAAALPVLLVAYSRMALGVHYFGDVLAALLSTGAWLVICLSGVHAWHAARHRQ
jgi:membrane-associated phospholipid phosphatase